MLRENFRFLCDSQIVLLDGATGTIRWDVDDPTICEVNNGVLTARKLGTTTVTATINGRTLTCKVKVVR